MASMSEITSESWSTMIDTVTELSNFSLWNVSEDKPLFLCNPASPNHVFQYILMILYLFVCIIGLFGNSLVI